MDYGSFLQDPNSPLDKRYLCNYNGAQWKWEDSQASQNAYKINDVASLYNVVSNGQAWYTCNPESILSSIPSTNPFNATGLTEFVGIFSNEPITVSLGPLTGGEQQSFAPPENIESVVSPETFEQLGIAEIIPVETPLVVGGIMFTVSPSQVARERKVALKVNWTGHSYYIDNISGFRILVDDNGDFIATNHTKQYSASNGLIGYNKPFNVTFPELEIGPHSLNVTIAISPTSKKTYLLENAFTVLEDVVTPSFNPLEINPGRMLCTKQGNNFGDGVFGAVLECCGPDYNYCLNNRYENIRIAGGPNALLHDYYGNTRGNSVLLAGFAQIVGRYNSRYPDNTPYFEHRYQLPIGKNVLPITDWSRYDALEFDMLLAGNNRLRILINTTAGTAIDEKAIVFSTSGEELSRWHHIRIPLNANLKDKEIKFIKFYVAQPDLLADVAAGNTKKVSFGGREYLMVLGLDRFLLTTNDPATTEGVQFCTSQNFGGVCDSYATDTATLAARNDDYSSVRVIGPLKVTAYKDANYAGNQIVFTQDDDGFVNDVFIDTTTSVNDAISSFKIERLSIPTQFCAPDTDEFSGGLSNVGKWIADLDLDKESCNNVVSFRWTGTQCCGDDQGVFNNQYPTGIETYNDVDGGCWNGIYARNNTATNVNAKI
jgi:hypothetical protein